MQSIWAPLNDYAVGAGLGVWIVQLAATSYVPVLIRSICRKVQFR